MGDETEKVVAADYIDPDLSEKVMEVSRLLDAGERVPLELEEVEEMVLAIKGQLDRIAILKR